MKHQVLKLLSLFVLLMPGMTIAVRNTRTGFCNEESCELIPSKGCGGTSKKFCALSACCAIINGPLIVDGTLTVNGSDLSSSNALASTVLGTGLVEPKIGYAEFVSTTTDNAAFAGADVFLFDREIINNTSGAVVAAVGAGGTIFTLAQGTYVIDYEAVLNQVNTTGPTYFQLYRGAIPFTFLNPDPTTVSGNSSANNSASMNWNGFTYGRLIIEVPSGGQIVALSGPPYQGAKVVAAYPTGPTIIRITFLKIA